MCDTLVQLADGRVRFAKNSDRDANEAQVLEWHLAREHLEGSRVRCTHAEIPQAPRTAAVLRGSRAEQGA
jgi:secernin